MGLGLSNSLYSYPAQLIGQPGFNPNHIAAGTYAFSAIPLSNGNFIDLIGLGSGAITNGTGAPVFLMDGNIGPGINFPTSAGTGHIDFAGQNVTNFTTVTVASIFRFSAVTAINQRLFSSSNTTGTGVTFGTNAAKVFGFQVPNNALAATTITALASVPYFFVCSFVSGASGFFNYLILRLDTGQILNAAKVTLSQTPGTPSGTFIIGNDFNLNREAQANIAAIMYSNAFLSIPSLRQWAKNPWDFWYPPNVQNLIFDSLSTPITGDTFALTGRSMYYM